MKIASMIIYLKNRNSTKAIKKIILYEVWYKKKPDLSHLRIIDITTYIHISKKLWKKLDFNAKIEILIEYDKRNQYRIWNSIRKNIIISHDIDFDEKKILKSIYNIKKYY